MCAMFDAGSAQLKLGSKRTDAFTAAIEMQVFVEDLHPSIVHFKLASFVPRGIQTHVLLIRSKAL